MRRNRLGRASLSLPFFLAQEFRGCRSPCSPTLAVGWMLKKNLVEIAFAPARASTSFPSRDSPRQRQISFPEERRRAMSLSLSLSLSLFVFGSKASDKLPRINDESGCRLVVIKNTPRKVKFLGLLLLRNFNLDLLWGRARKSSQLLPRSPWQPDIST